MSRMVSFLRSIDKNEGPLSKDVLALLKAEDRNVAGMSDYLGRLVQKMGFLLEATLGLVNRFEEVHAAAQGTVLEPNLVGELIASEVEVKTGRCETFAEIPAALAERRGQLQVVVDPLGIALGVVLLTATWALPMSRLSRGLLATAISGVACAA